jgi:L-ascorbate metabolism protein UlaG (beta-lactamase superfamily)
LIFFIVILLLGVFLSPASSQEKVVLKWLGNAGWEIQLSKTIILIDPFLTRKERVMDAEWKTDGSAVLKVITGADYIFAGHSHHDHIGDVPFIAKRFGAKIIGSRTTANLALSAGVDKAQLTTVTGGEKLAFKEFAVEVVQSRHAIVQRSGRKPAASPEEILAPLERPLVGKDFVEGGSYLYYFSFGKHRLLNQSTANFVEEKLTGLRPDVALLAEAARSYDLKNALKTLKPKVVIIQHYDEWRAPFSQGLPDSNRKRAERFRRDILAADGAIKVVVPDFLMTYMLE